MLILTREHLIHSFVVYIVVKSIGLDSLSYLNKVSLVD